MKRRTFYYALALWVVGFVYSMIVMWAIGVEFSKDMNFGVDHPLYWEFEKIMFPSFVIFTIIVHYLLFRGMEFSDDWKRRAMSHGDQVMLVQFALDLVVIAGIFGNGIDYFYGMVTPLYLTIPLWALVAAWLVRARQ